MKKITFLLSLLFTVVSLHAQDYQISFAGTGASATVGTVTVENQTQGKSISLLGSETLHLLAIITGNAPTLDNVNFPLRVYPNPSSDFFTIEFGAIKSGPVTIMLFDQMGRETGNLKQSLPSGNHSFRISGLKSGIYTIKIDHDNQSYSGKLISQGSSNPKVTITYIGNKGAVQETFKIKNATTERFWQYNTDDILSFTGTSGNLSAVITDIPTKSKILTFNFTASLPAVTTAAATNIISTGAMLGGNVTSDGNATVTERGVVFSTNANPTTLDTKVINGTGIGTFSSAISGLTPNTTYYVRTYATNSMGTVYGSEISLKTLVTNPPYRAAFYVGQTYDSTTAHSFDYKFGENVTITTYSVPGRNYFFISIPTGCSFSASNGGVDITDNFIFIGVDNKTGYMGNSVWRKNPSYASEDSVDVSIIIFPSDIHNPPIVFSGLAWNVNSTYAFIDDHLLYDGNDTLTEHGILYCSEKDLPLYTKVVDGSGEIEFSNVIYDLTPNTTYFYRAYASNSIATTYGAQLSFKTPELNLTLPYRAAISVDRVGFNYLFSTELSYVENEVITFSNPIRDGGNSLVLSIPVDKTFSLRNPISDVTSSCYLVGTNIKSGYRNNNVYILQPGFNTANPVNFYLTIYDAEYPSLAGVISEAVSGITDKSAILGGSVVSDGKAAVTEKGFVISTSTNPTISDTKVINGTGTGSFSSTISGLTGNTTYYVRAYATNSKGTVYGSQVSFKTLLQYRMAMCVAKTEYDKSSEVNISYVVNKEIKLYSPVKDGTNYFFISIPANKKFIIKDEMRSDASSDFQKVGEDNREGYWNNNIYKFRKIYSTGYSRNFYLTISEN
jgi:hypothetical protein